MDLKEISFTNTVSRGLKNNFWIVKGKAILVTGHGVP
jgi:hypothetical protein